jgi:3-phosphoshikimate 1-carboxyvinyltransferase
MAYKTIKPTKSLKGTIKLPGDKSISHRALIFASIAEGDSTICGLSSAADVSSTQRCLQQLGVSMEADADRVIVHGNGSYGLKAPSGPLDAGNSGTTIRLMAGVLAAQNFISIIDGDESLRSRPMRRIIEPLENMGAKIESASFKAPLTIYGGPLRAIDYAMPIASAQVKSCILLAGLYAKGITQVTWPAESRDHTERMLEEFGASAQYSTGGAGVKGPAVLHGCTIDVPGDVSAAAFFLVAACLLPETEIEITNVGVNPLRTGIIDALSSMGAMIRQKEITVINHEPRATLIPASGSLKATSLGGGMIPRLIDEIPVLAIAATQAEGTTIIRDAEELRVKETDRLSAISDNLKRMGANIRETKDGLMITGPTRLQGAEIDSFGDHRIAMSFAIAALIAEGKSRIKNTECVDISFPGFFELLESLRND